MGESTPKVIFPNHGHAPYEKPPASPNDPRLHDPSHHAKNENQPAANNFKVGIEGPDPILMVGGDSEEQLRQGACTAALSLAQTGPRSDSLIQSELDKLKPNPPQGTDGVDVTHVVYQSHIPEASAEMAYRHFIDEPGAVFAAANLTILPKADQLKDGAKYLLELHQTPPAWLPIQVHLDPVKHSITIDTLDGHALRGHQTFTFTNDGRGGCILTQDAHYQISSKMIDVVQRVESVANTQHDGWVNAHREIYDNFHDKFKSLPHHLDHPSHPGHAMFQQAQEKIGQLNAQYGIAASDRDKDFAAFVAVNVKANGITCIDHLMLSDDGNQVFAVQGHLGSPQKQVVSMVTMDALGTPIAQSSAAWQQAALQGQVLRPPQSESQRLGPAI